MTIYKIVHFEEPVTEKSLRARQFMSKSHVMLWIVRIEGWAAGYLECVGHGEILGSRMTIRSFRRATHREISSVVFNS
jgi:hypothetical protein